MPHKVFFTALLVFACLFTQAQTIVSTAPQSRKAVMEEYGGFSCGYCPEGHLISNALKASYGDQLVLINVQSGSYAVPGPDDPDLRSDYGAALESQTGLIGYPAATVNRLIFPGMQQGGANSTAMSRTHWDNAIEATLNMPSPVNIAMESCIDMPTGMLTVYVEIFYTANSSESENYLHIGILQDNIQGPQLIDETWTQNYTHRHVLRDFLTGQWGDVISNTSAGHFESRTYTCALPGIYKNVVVDPSEIEIVGFISKGHQHIYTGTTVHPTYDLHTLDANAINIKADHDLICGNWLEPTLTLRNDGQQTLTAATIEYAINNGSVHTAYWSGSLPTFEHEEIVLPGIYFNPNQGTANTIEAEIVAVNNGYDNVLVNNNAAKNFEGVPMIETIGLTVDIRTDYYGYETYWEIINDAGQIVASGGNLNVGANGGGQQLASSSDPGAYASNALSTHHVELPAEGCYEFRVLDDYGDGMCCNYGNGFFRVKDDNGTLLFYGGNFEVAKELGFEYGNLFTAVSDLNTDWEARLFPNPVTEDWFQFELTIPQSGQLQLSLFNVNGQLMSESIEKVTAGNLFNRKYDTSTLPPGTYFLHASLGNQQFTRKVLVQ